MITWDEQFLFLHKILTKKCFTYKSYLFDFNFFPNFFLRLLLSISLNFWVLLFLLSRKFPHHLRFIVILSNRRIIWSGYIRIMCCSQDKSEWLCEWENENSMVVPILVWVSRFFFSIYLFTYFFSYFSIGGCCSYLVVVLFFHDLHIL